MTSDMEGAITQLKGCKDRLFKMFSIAMKEQAKVGHKYTGSMDLNPVRPMTSAKSYSKFE